MSTAFSLAPLFRSSVGFDRFNDLFETALRNEPGSTYPPYNVEKHGDDQYRIVVAAAGFQEEDLDLQVEKGVLTCNVPVSGKAGLALRRAGMAPRRVSPSA